MNLEDRIALGTQFLDDVKPGWVELIDRDSLDLSEPSSCILGQLFAPEAEARRLADGPFSAGAFTLGSWAFHDWLADHGYDMDGNEHVDINAAEMGGFERNGTSMGAGDPDETYAALQEQWDFVILGRMQD